MATGSEEITSTEVVRWYTRARRFPQLIGRTHDGAKIWGGPYTVTQVIGAGVLAVLASITTSLWARFGFFANVALFVCVFAVVVVGLGKISPGSRNPLAAVTGAVQSLNMPAFGRLAGRRVQPGRPVQVRHRIVIAAPVQETPVQETPVQETPAQEPAPAETTPRPAAQAPAQTRAQVALDELLEEQPTREAPPTQPAPLSGVQALLAGSSATSDDQSVHQTPPA